MYMVLQRLEQTAVFQDCMMHSVPMPTVGCVVPRLHDTQYIRQQRDVWSPWARATSSGCCMKQHGIRCCCAEGTLPLWADCRLLCRRDIAVMADCRLLCRRDIAIVGDCRLYLWGSERQRLHLKADPGGVSPSWAKAIAQVNQLYTNIAALYTQQHNVAHTLSKGQYLNCKCHSL